MEQEQSPDLGDLGIEVDPRGLVIVAFYTREGWIRPHFSVEKAEHLRGMLDQAIAQAKTFREQYSGPITTETQPPPERQALYRQPVVLIDLTRKPSTTAEEETPYVENGHTEPCAVAGCGKPAVHFRDGQTYCADHKPYSRPAAREELEESLLPSFEEVQRNGFYQGMLTNTCPGCGSNLRVARAWTPGFAWCLHCKKPVALAVEPSEPQQTEADEVIDSVDIETEARASEQDPEAFERIYKVIEFACRTNHPSYTHMMDLASYWLPSDALWDELCRRLDAGTKV